MCGIVGIIGSDNATEFLLQGLEYLEYRGYDSAGIAVLGENIQIEKEKGKISQLRGATKINTITGTTGIGHTRWATHGQPSKENAHPHTSTNSEFAIVHNGIIENYIELKEMLKKEGFSFYSDTDTEVIPKLIEYNYTDSLFDAVQKTIKMLRGSFAILAIAKSEPDKIIAIRKESPMIIGIGENENYAASDITAIVDKTKNIIILENEQIAIIKKDNIHLFDFNGHQIETKTTCIDWDIEKAEKAGFPHFMMKEIFEQATVATNTLKMYGGNKDNLGLHSINFSKEYLESVEKIYIIACGTAYNAGLIGKTIIEKFTNIPVEIDVASEFRYRNPIATAKTLAVFVSQSGETADTIAALKLSKELGMKTLAITNVMGSSITREADCSVYIQAGTEISVASTKAYTGQVLMLMLLGLHLGKVKKLDDTKEYKSFCNDLFHIPSLFTELLERSDEIKQIANKLKDTKNMFYIGRGLDYASIVEASLKIKEISYIHSEGFPAGELKHGPIALIEENTPVVALCTQKDLLEKTISNIKEVKARGAMVICLGLSEFKELEEVADFTFLFNIDNELLAPLSSTIPLQFLAYYTALVKGCEIDQPRNLAKSVTVE